LEVEEEEEVMKEDKEVGVRMDIIGEKLLGELVQTAFCTHS